MKFSIRLYVIGRKKLSESEKKFLGAKNDYFCLCKSLKKYQNQLFEYPMCAMNCLSSHNQINT